MVDNDSIDDHHGHSSDHGGDALLETNHATRRTTQKERLMQRVTIVAVGICSILYCTISFIALADFGRNVQPNMLSCYSNNATSSDGNSSSTSSTLIQIATAAMALAIVMAFPLNIFPARVTLIGLWHNYSKQRQLLTSEATSNDNNLESSISLHGIGPHHGLTAALLDDEEIDEHVLLPNSNMEHGSSNRSLVPTLDVSSNGYHEIENQENGPTTTTTTHFADSDPPFNRTVHIVSTLFLTTSTLILALILPNISVVFGLLGGTASSWLGFCVPGLLGIQLYKNECASGMPPRYRLLLTSWALLAGGIVVGVLTTGVTIYNTILH